MEKGIMVHYLPTKDSVTGDTIEYAGYKEQVEKDHSEFKHIYFPSNHKEGIEIIKYPGDNQKAVL